MKVNITCEAEIGPADEFQKTVKWLRANTAPLPHGVSSQSVNNKAFLIIESPIADHTGSYGCFVRPAAGLGRAKLNLIINGNFTLFICLIYRNPNHAFSKD